MNTRKATLRRLLAGLLCSTTSLAAFALADGSWLKKVPAADHARVNPLAGNAQAVTSGGNLFRNNCAKCHGEAGLGKGSRPSLRSGRIAGTTDGDIAWLLKNGNPFRGMPGWGGLPEQSRWQLVDFVRSLNTPAPAATPSADAAPGAAR